MKRWSRWVAFLSRREDPASLAFARMVAGAAIAWDLLSMQRTGAAAMLWVDSAHGGMRPMYAPGWLQALGGATPSNVKLLMAIGGEPWGHLTAALVEALPAPGGDAGVLDAARRLDKHYIPARYPNGFVASYPGRMYTRGEAQQAIADATFITEFCRRRLPGQGATG